MQMVSLVINPNGVARDHEMYRVEEYAFFIYFGNVEPAMLDDTFFTSEVAQVTSRMAKIKCGALCNLGGELFGQ